MSTGPKGNGISSDTGFPQNITEYRFESVQIGGEITNSMLHIENQGFKPDDYNFVTNNCQYYMSYIRKNVLKRTIPGESSEE